MAELFGVFGAGVGIAAAAGQLIDGIMKLDLLCSQIQDIPGDIQAAVDDLSTMVEILKFVQSEISHETLLPNSSSSTKVLLNLQQSSQQVGEVLEEMRTKLGKKKYWGRIKAVRLIKKLEKAAKRVENAQRMVLILLVMENRMTLRQSYNAQKAENITESTHILSVSNVGQFASNIPRKNRWIDDIEDSKTDEGPDCIGLALQLPIQRSSEAKSHNTTIMRLRLPRFFLKAVWEVSICKANQGWDFSLRSYNIRPANAPIFEAIRNGDLSQAHELLRSGRASIWDRNSLGRGVLHLAAKGCHVHGPTIIEYLVKSGTDINSVDFRGLTPHYHLFSPRFNSKDEKVGERLLAGYEVFASHRDWTPSRPRMWLVYKNRRVLGDMIDTLPIFKNPPQKIIRSVLYGMWLSWKDTPPADRMITLFPNFTITELAHVGRRETDPLCLRECLSREDIQQTFANWGAEAKFNLIWYTLDALAGHLVLGLEKGIEEARLFLKDMHMTNSFIDALQKADPLCSFVTAYAVTSLGGQGKKSRRLEQYLHYAQEGLNYYISELMILGIDMATVADMEKEVQSRQQGKYLSRGRDQSDSSDRIAIDYGLKADDWHLWLSHPRDNWAQEFWDMVDHPERDVPGAWEED